MKRFLISLLVVLAGGAVALLLMASRYESKIRPNTRVGVIDVGGLVPTDAAKKLRIWWETEKLREVTLQVPNGRGAPMQIILARLGVKLDDLRSVSDLPMDDFWESAARNLSQGEGTANKFEPKLSLDEKALDGIDTYVKKSIGSPRPALVSYKNGQIIREPEVSGYSVDRPSFLTAVLDGLKGDGKITVPIQEASKRIPDTELEKISEVVSEYTTHFPSRQASRNTNLRIASGKINGKILLPGEIFSFNETVGRRTIEDGYKIAGVYKNGKHDTALAGGICQVSGTLYNAVLLANLKIDHRENHSMPVAYLPVGRDATVDYGTKDLRFENSTDHPIALYSNYETGRLTFGVLGQREAGLSVEIVTSGHKSWSRGVQYVTDRSLAPGKTKVVEKGASGHQIDTYRVVKKDGVEVRREYLGRSRYAGGVRIIARGPAAAPAPPSEPVVSGEPEGQQ